jgi:hypothetical protein
MKASFAAVVISSLLDDKFANIDANGNDDFVFNLTIINAAITTKIINIIIKIFNPEIFPGHKYQINITIEIEITNSGI